MNDDVMRTLHEMADEHGEVAYTSNTRSLLDQAVERGLAKAISGKFKMLEPGTLNSMYRLIKP